MNYTPDNKYEKSRKVIEYLLEDKALPRSMKDITEGEMVDLLLYHITKQNEYIEVQLERIKEYQSIFDAMSRFIKPKGPTIYG